MKEARYRYTLRRELNRQVSLLDTSPKGVLLWLMLNPSTADEHRDDPTIRRCIGFSRRWGYSRMLVGNLFAVRATNPADLAEFADPVGPENDVKIKEMVLKADRTVAAWGAEPAAGHRAERVVKMVTEECRRDLFTLGLTARTSAPRHPLYVPAAQDLELWRRWR